MKRQPPPRPPARRRAALLAAAAGAGLAVGAGVQAIADSQAGWLAVPAIVALAWWRVADPTRCDGP